MKYVILKVETTGLDPIVDDIIHISAYKIVENNLIEPMSYFINPKMEISEEASNISGIRNEHVANAPTFDELKDKILDFIGDFPIIGHNINFDLSFINKHLDHPLENKKMSLMDMARAMGYTGSLKLSNMCHYYGVMYTVDKVRTINSLFKAMIEEYTKKKDNKDA